MKTAKLFIIFICLIFLTNLCQAEQYYCANPQENYNISNLYYADQTAEQNCKWLKTDIIISDKPLTYNYKKCIANFNAAKAKYDKGMCTPVLTKNHIYKYQGKKNKLSKDYKCEVKHIKGTSLVIETRCNTDEEEISESAMDYFSRLYRKQNGIYYVK